MPQYSEGVLGSTVSANTLLAATPKSSGGGTQYLSVWASSSVLSVVEIQHRNAADNANVSAHRFWISATDPLVIANPPNGYNLDDQEYIRVWLVAGILGSVQATIHT